MALRRSDHPFCPSRDLVATLTHGTQQGLTRTVPESRNILNQTLIPVKDVTLRAPELF